jgi:exonuclease III
VSVYIPSEGGLDGTRTLNQALEAIRHTYQRVRYEYGDEFDVLIVGDFNCHHQLWGGNQVAIRAHQGELEPILLLMADWA